MTEAAVRARRHSGERRAVRLPTAQTHAVGYPNAQAVAGFPSFWARATGIEGSILRQQPDDLGHEEGVPFSLGVNRLDQLTRRLGLSRALKENLHILFGQALETNLLKKGLAGNLSQRRR